MVTVTLDEWLYVEKVEGDVPIDILGMHILTAESKLETEGWRSQDTSSNIYEVKFSPAS